MMKKTIALISLLSVLCLNTSPVWAGGGIGKPKPPKPKTVHATVIKHTHSTRRLPTPKASLGKENPLSHVVKREDITSLNSRRELTKNSNAPVASSLYLPHVGQEISPLVQRTFQARPTGTDYNFVSGTIFRTEAGEIFGVVATHGLARVGSLPRVERSFEADVFDVNSQHFVTVPAEIVQLSAPEFLDLALVKFHLPPEVKLQAFIISQEDNLWKNPVLHSQGFSSQNPIHTANRTLRNTTPYSFRTFLPLQRENRKGLCGAAVLNENNELVGIHTGSVFSTWAESEDVGYATPVKFLNMLVDAYYHDGKATVPFVLQEEHIIDLNIDEYVSKAVLLDSQFEVMDVQVFAEKFAYHQLMETIEEKMMTGMRPPRYLNIEVRRIGWDETEPNKLPQDDQQAKTAVKTYRYDFETQEIRELTPEELN